MIRSEFQFCNIPPDWQLVINTEDSKAWVHKMRKLSVVASVAFEKDGKLWLHVSMAHPKRIPTYEDICYLKRHWIGDDNYAIMIFPKSENHVNIHRNCLHLWCCLDGHPLPEFSEILSIGGKKIRSI